MDNTTLPPQLVEVIPTITGTLNNFFAESTFSASIFFLLAVFAFFIYVFVKADKDPNSELEYEDLFLDTATRKTNPYKLGFLVGIFIGGWVIVVQSDNGTLTSELFLIYLTYLLGGAGIKSFIAKKYGNGDNSPNMFSSGRK